MNKHEAILPDGQVAKRVSKNRTYSHMVAVRRSKAHAVAEANKIQPHDRENFRYYQDIVAGRREAYGDMAERAKVELALASTPEAYAEAKRVQRSVAVEKQDFTKWGALTWCGNARLAESQLRTAQAKPYYAEAKIIPTTLKN